MNNIIAVVIIVLASNYQPLNAKTIPIIKQLNTHTNRPSQSNVLLTFPVTKIINAQKLNNFVPPTLSSPTNPAAKNNFDSPVIDSIVNTNELIRNFLNSIDFDKIFDRFDNISLGKVLRHLFKQIFPNGVPQKLAEALCNSSSTQSYGTTKKPLSTTQSYKTTTTTEQPIFPTAPITPDPLYYRTTEKTKQFFNYVEPLENTVVDAEENYDEVVIDTHSDLKEEPVTDDYIEDQPIPSAKQQTNFESLELKKSKREIDDDLNEISLLAWLQSLFA